MKPMSNYPEHEKLRAIAGESQACGEFLEWLQHQGYVMALAHRHDSDCRGKDGWRLCGRREGELIHAPLPSIQKLLATFFGIDPEKLEDEKQAMLAELRAQQ